MSLPEIPQKAPYKIEAVAGEKYAWCTCGLSEKQPYCDGKHKGTEFRPLVGKFEESKTYWLCGCKHTQNGPFCDGRHKTLDD